MGVFNFGSICIFTCQSVLPRSVLNSAELGYLKLPQLADEVILIAHSAFLSLCQIFLFLIFCLI